MLDNYCDNYDVFILQAKKRKVEQAAKKKKETQPKQTAQQS